MFKIAASLIITFLMYGCASTDGNPALSNGLTSKTHVLSAGNGKKLSFKSTGCKIAEGTLKNMSDFASAGSYGTLNVANSKSNSIIDQYRVSCAAVAAGRSSSCVIQRVAGSGSDKDYGGLDCPDMKFELVNFRSF